MRSSIRCIECNEPIKIGWKVCPQCGVDLEDLGNLSTDHLRNQIISDVEKFYSEDRLYNGAKFIKKLAETCLEDWEWANQLGFKQGHWFIARCYEMGILSVPDNGMEETEKGELMAAKLFTKAATKEFPPAQNDLGHYILSGKGGLTKNSIEGFKWIQKAALHGYAAAKLSLGYRYEYGDGVPIDKARAMQIRFELAEEGFPPAQTELGVLYRLGDDGLPRDPVSALEWYRKSAEQGFSEAMFEIGCLYYNGEGVQKNKSQARQWFYRALKHNFALAKMVIDKEEKKLFPWKF